MAAWKIALSCNFSEDELFSVIHHRSFFCFTARRAFSALHTNESGISCGAFFNRIFFIQIKRKTLLNGDVVILSSTMLGPQVTLTSLHVE